MNTTNTPTVACVIGAGDATGSSVARRFAREGYVVCAARRTEAALAQSMARELGPKGVHVAHVMVDGLIDTAFSRTSFADRVAAAGPDGILNPDHIADTYWGLHQQPRDAWSFEVDLRPWVERW